MEARQPLVTTESVEVEFDSECRAEVRETWRATVPAGLSGDALRAHLHKLLDSDQCTFVDEEAYAKEDRCVVAISVLRDISDVPPQLSA
jgi:hypothetical protein